MPTVSGTPTQVMVKRIKAVALREAADEAEWIFRSMSFACGKGESTTKLHPVGKWLRDRADELDGGEDK